MTRISVGLLLTASFLSSCDIVAPNRGESVSATTASGLRITMALEPANVYPLGSFEVVLSAKNVSTSDLAVSAAAPRVSDETTLSFEGQISFERNGTAGVFQGLDAPCSGIVGKMVNDRAHRIAKPNQELFIRGECRQGYRAQPTTTAGEYTVTFLHTLRVDSPAVEVTTPLVLTLKVRD